MLWNKRPLWEWYTWYLSDFWNNCGPKHEPLLWETSQKRHCGHKMCDSKMFLSEFVLLLILRHPYNRHITKKTAVLFLRRLLFYVILINIEDFEFKQIRFWTFLFHIRRCITWTSAEICLDTGYDDVVWWRFDFSIVLCVLGMKTFTYIRTSISSKLIYRWSVIRAELKAKWPHQSDPTQRFSGSICGRNECFRSICVRTRRVTSFPFLFTWRIPTGWGLNITISWIPA